jgi:ubiquinol-cytochrome c reductase cytochrome c subunit
MSYSNSDTNGRPASGVSSSRRTSEGRSRSPLRWMLPAAVVMIVAVFAAASAMASATTPRHKDSIPVPTPKERYKGGQHVPVSSEQGGNLPGAPGSLVSGYPTVSLKRYSAHEGYILFEENCSSCHGPEASGSSIAPNLVGLGAATIDFWVSTGRMPLADPTVEPEVKPSRFTPTQTLDIVKFITSLGPGGPGIPKLNLKNVNVNEGQRLFTLNCASCHTITGAGDALSGGAYAPSLHFATAEQIGDAIRSGPGEMPRFGPGELTPQQVDDIVAYVKNYIQHPVDPGGAGLGGVGPVAEGFIALLVGVGGLMLVAFWIGDRA